MSTGEQPQQDANAASSANSVNQESGILDAAIAATKQTEPDRAEDLIRTLTEAAMQGTVTFDKDVTRTINAGIAAIDATISKQLAVIMHTPEFQKLEGSWRGLHYLVDQSETGSQLKLKVLNCSKKDLFKDLDKAVEFDQSQIFKKVYENEFGTPGGEPYGALMGDYEFTNHPDDIDLLTNMSGVAAAGFCPFLSAADPNLCGLDNWTELSKPRDLEKIFDTAEYTKWRSFRESEDSRFVTLTMPRVLARLPYGASTKPSEGFDYEEVPLGDDGKPISVSHDEYCWMNAAYVLGSKLTDAFAQTGWCTAIRGAEGGGKVEGLPAHVFQADDGDMDLKCPTELAITERREGELGKLGFLPLCHYKNTDYAVFFGAQTTQKPQKFDRPEATANAAISARLPYIMASARFAHFLKVIGRDKIGSFMEVEDCQDWLDRWIHNYVSADTSPSEEAKARYPLREAKIEVKEIPGQPGAYNAVAWLRPWMQMEELTTSMRMVARIPKIGG
ncbi:MAG TPA: type VI secretion system contractile sheath large subunit [Planctomycetaceae bacterium]|nr:type VI secretion system contractile sheath large subunit [Planctomycetaceae bacterium]|tara:strand:+ start:25001 stop:26509 length:1509 start_codon:yes stop_codon:yes gene_type:complete